MKENIKLLKEKFKEIKNLGLVQSLRKGTTGLGYTFESLLGKSEDSKPIPDFNGIEIKTKLGYSKSPITLFTLAPHKNNDYAIDYILHNFGYPTNNSKLKAFRGDVYYTKNNIIANRYICKLFFSDDYKILKLLIFDTKLNLINNEIYWDVQDMTERIITKTNYLAIIKGYPYNKNNDIFYKYVSLTIYKYKGTTTFIELLKQNKIYVTFNIGMHSDANKFGQICDRGTAFRIKIDYIDELFDKISD